MYFKRYVAKTIPQEETPALIEGQQAHSLIVEGWTAFAKENVIASPGLKLNTTDGRQFKESAVSSGRRVISNADYQILAHMRDAVMAHPSASALITGCETEVTWRAQATHFLVQCRTDWWNESATQDLIDLLQEQSDIYWASQKMAQGDRPKVRLDVGQPFAVDLKKCRDLNEGFAPHFANFNYHRQPAFYRGVLEGYFGLPPVEWFNICCEAQEPFRVAVHQPDMNSVEIVGFPVVNTAMAQLATCYERNEWPGLPNAVLPVSLSPWKMKQELDYFYSHDTR